MKIIYEFDPLEDKSDLLIIQNSHKMYHALFEIDGILREVRKGYVEYNDDEFLDVITGIICDSAIHEID